MTEDEDFHPHTIDGRVPWNNEDWLIFSEAVREIVATVGLSRGVAERTLRVLCSSGDVRSICCDEDFDEKPTIIEPEKWRETGELDLHGVVVSRVKWTERSRTAVKSWPEGEGKLDCEQRWHDTVLVSEADLRHWLKTQTKQATTEPKKKALGKRPKIKVHLANLFPDGVPDPAYCNRKELIRELLKIDPGLKPLDDDTLKTAIDEYNSDPK
jgi:hypothetical protein